jgi:Bacteriophage HK97-gp10, putative tail-component
MARRSGIRGGASLAKRLKALPDAVRADAVADLTAIGGRMLTRAKARTPKRTGALAEALEVKVLTGSLRIKLGLLSKGRARKFFYGRILDVGRRGRIVTIKRGPRKGRPMRIAEISPDRYDFVLGGRADFRRNELPGFRERYVKSLKRALSKG